MHQNALTSKRRCDECGLPNVGHSETCQRCRWFAHILGHKQDAEAIIAWSVDCGVCVYCGEYGVEIEHVIPRRMEIRTFTVRACRECNSIASGTLFETLAEKTQFVRARRARRYKKLLAMPEWDESELAEIKGRLRKYICGTLAARELVMAQIEWSAVEAFYEALGAQ